MSLLDGKTLEEWIPEPAYVYMWPDGDWCNEEDLEVMLTYHSDDFIKREVQEWTEQGDPIVNGEVLQ